MKLPKGHDKVIEILNQILTNELTGINQYFIHAKMAENWGYQRLAKKIRDESIDEMKHADQLISRILFLEGLPNLQRLGKINVGESMTEALALDLDLERGAIVDLNVSLETVRALGDHGTFHLLNELLTSEEHHADWLESQVEQIKQIGVENYLTAQIDE